MKMQEIVIRSATTEDADVLLKIYRYYVENTAISFEYEAPSIVEFKEKIINTLKSYPYLVAERNGQILGYAYASKFRPQTAYNRCVEVSIYVDKKERGTGVGRLLYDELETQLKNQQIFNLYACIAYTDQEDEYLNNNSAKFHAHLGYTEIGRFHKCGCKFERWYDMIWMEKLIG